MGVTRVYERLKMDRTPRGMHAGLQRDSVQRGHLEHISTLVWMRSHQPLADNATEEEKRRHWGNDRADKMAEEKTQGP